jgi:hypothetical protein
MKRFLLAIGCTLLRNMTPVFAGLALPGEGNPVVGETSITIGNDEYNVVKRIEKESVTITLTGKKGDVFWTSESLGVQEKLFNIDSAAKGIAIKDLTGDGVAEIIAAAMTGEDRSALYVFSFNKDTGKFAPVEFNYEKQNLKREFVVSDIYQANGDDYLFSEDGKLRVLGQIYSESGETPPVAGFYFFQFRNNLFVNTSVEPVPTGKSE